MVRIPSLSRSRDTAPVRDENGDGVVDGRDGAGQSERGTTGRVGGTSPTVDGDATTYRSSSAAPGASADGGPWAGGPGRDRLRADDTVADGSRTGLVASERNAADRAATASAITGRPRPESERLVAAHRDADGTTDLEETVDVNPTTATDGRVPVGARRDPEFHRETGRATVAPVDPDPTDTGHVETGEPVEVAPVGPRPRASLLATVSLILGVAAALFVLTGALAGYGIALGALGALLGVAGLGATRRRHVAGKADALIGIVLGLAAVVAGILAMTGQFDWPNTDGETVQRFREWLDSQFADRF